MEGICKRDFKIRDLFGVGSKHYMDDWIERDSPLLTFTCLAPRYGCELSNWELSFVLYEVALESKTQSVLLGELVATKALELQIYEGSIRYQHLIAEWPNFLQIWHWMTEVFGLFWKLVRASLERGEIEFLSKPGARCLLLQDGNLLHPLPQEKRANYWSMLRDAASSRVVSCWRLSSSLQRSA